ncbi:quinon protein alcohol dehydrogenase-like superfamily, partial [Paraphoma chrysanthemicola]
MSLRSQIHEVTTIPHQVLEGTPLSEYSVDERLRWRQHRHTKLVEDAAYSLSGIFDVDIAPVYGEGTEQAFRRLHDKIRKQEDSFRKREECLHDLRATDPRNDKRRIEETKGGLLADSYRWVFENTAFQQWRQEPHSRLLWVKGDPGKGKTMLLCGIINELQKAATNAVTVSYFFCQATDSRINTATAVLRGLLYMLVDQQPSLISHIRKKHDVAGESLFNDANAWVALTEIWADVLQDPDLRRTYLIIDALDECVTNLLELLDFIAKQSSVSSRVKWIVSSRNWPDIEAQLERAGHKVRLSLELNAKSVAAAVAVFIRQKVDQLAQEKQYKADLRHTVLQHLKSNADDTFLWVALVCQDLRKTPKWNVLKKLTSFPPGLDSLYKRMMDQISESDGAEICRQVLASTAILYQPMAIAELVALVEQLEELDDLEAVREIVGFCGSFLTLREDTVYFVHQSAKDFLLTKASDEIFPDGTGTAHRVIFSKSLAVLSSTLYRDMYSLKAPGSAIENVKPPHLDPLAASRYPCVYWIDHLYQSNALRSSVGGLQAEDAVDDFLRKKYLYWLEGLSLCKSVGKGVVSMEKLCSLVQEMCDQDKLAELVQDARRFIMYHKGAIERYPLQTYTSALLFSPTGSLIRQLFQHEEPETIGIRPGLSDGWSACLQTLEGHSDSVKSVAFSHDSARLASASSDNTVKIWDASSGACLQTLEGHSDSVKSVAFSHDSARLASASDDSTVKIWDASSGACLQTLEGHSDSVKSVAFSHDSARLASASSDSTVKIWDASSGACLQTLEGHSDSVKSVAFSHDSARLASASSDSTVKIWDASSGACLQTLEGHSDSVKSVAFSHDSARLASASSDSTVKIWDASSGACLQTLEGHSDSVKSVAFSHDSARLASASYDSTVKIWDASSGACLQTLEGHSRTVNSVAFSHDSARLASASYDSTIKIWDASSGACLQTLEGHSRTVNLVAFSHDSTKLASASDDSTVKIWDASSGACLQTLEGYSSSVNSVAFSPDSARLASASSDSTVKIWDASSGACLQTLEGHSSFVRSVAFSHDSARLAS